MLGHFAEGSSFHLVKSGFNSALEDIRDVFGQDFQFVDLMLTVFNVCRQKERKIALSNFEYT